MQELFDITRALIYSVSVCYYARLSDKAFMVDENEKENLDQSGQNHRRKFVTHLVEKFSHGDFDLKVDSVKSKVALFEDEIVR